MRVRISWTRSSARNLLAGPIYRMRSRHLSKDEVEELIEAAKNNRHSRRDALLILIFGRSTPPLLIIQASGSHCAKAYWSFVSAYQKSRLEIAQSCCVSIKILQFVSL